MSSRGIASRQPSSVLIQQAVTLQQSGRLSEAQEIYQSVLNAEPNNYDAMHLLGMVYYSSKDYVRAESLVRKAISLRRNQAEFHCNYGLILQALGRLEDAQRAYDLAIKLKPNYPAAYINRGLMHLVNRRYSDALADFDLSISIAPSAAAFTNRGLALKSLQRYQESVESFEMAIRIDDKFVDAYINLGAGYSFFGDEPRALACFNKAVSLNPQSPAALGNRASALRELCQFNDALKTIERAVKIRPDNTELRANLAAILCDLERYDEGLRLYKSCVESAPSNKTYNWGVALTLLSLGQYSAAWPYYEFRINNPKLGIVPPDTGAGRWSATDTDASLLVTEEQGIGDTMFFARALMQASQNAKHVTIRVDKRLSSLFKRSFPFVTTMTTDIPISEITHEKYSLIGSLFLVLDQKLDAKTDHFRKKYLISDAKITEEVKNTLQASNKFTCGIMWKSQRPQTGRFKSVSLEQLLPVLRVPNVQFVSLQYGDVEREISDLEHEHGVKVTQVPGIDNKNDIERHASLIDACDFILGVSNSSAHIAGALGKPGVILLSRGPGRLFYWNNRSNGASYWYPSLNILDQSLDLNWDAAISGAAEMLAVAVRKSQNSTV